MPAPLTVSPRDWWTARKFGKTRTCPFAFCGPSAVASRRWTWRSSLPISIPRTNMNILLGKENVSPPRTLRQNFVYRLCAPNTVVPRRGGLSQPKFVERSSQIELANRLIGSSGRDKLSFPQPSSTHNLARTASSQSRMDWWTSRRWRPRRARRRGPASRRVRRWARAGREPTKARRWPGRCLPSASQGGTERETTTDIVVSLRSSGDRFDLSTARVQPQLSFICSVIDFGERVEACQHE